MTTVVLKYRGEQSQRQEAEARLRRTLPGVTLTSKTSTTIEADLKPDQVDQLTGGVDWQVSQPVYAEIRPPVTNLSKLRQRLAGKK